MIHFADISQAASIVNEKNVTKFIVPVSADTITENNFVVTIGRKYQDLIQKLTDQVTKKQPKAGDFIKIQLDSGHTVFCIVIRNVEKFQASIFDMTKALRAVMDALRKDVDVSTSVICQVLFPLPPYDELKLSDTLVIPALSEIVNVPYADVHFLSTTDVSDYVEQVTEDAVYFKRDSWKSDWMFSQDDLLFVSVLVELMNQMPDYKLNKANLVRCYHICHQNGMYPKIEWFQTEYGPFFKQFLVKSNSLLCHGVLANIFHYSTQEPKKFSCILGPMIPYLSHVAFTTLAKHRGRVLGIVDLIRKDFFENLKTKAESTPSSSPNTPRQYQKPEENLFTL